MKTILFSILLMLAFAGSNFAQIMTGEVFAQERVECRLQNPGAILPTEFFESPTAFATIASAPSSAAISEDPDPTPLLLKGGKKITPQALSFKFTVTTDTVIRFNSSDGGAIEGTIKNLTHDQLNIVFRRWQFLPNANWSTTVCLDQCYADFVDSLPWGITEYSPIPPDGSIPFILHFYSPDNSTDSATAYIRLAAAGSTEDDTVGMWFKGVASLPSAVHHSNASANGYKISSVYPSPLISGSSIKAKIYSPQSTTYSYSIFDAVGREVAYGSTRHRLLIGDNTIEITSLEGLTAGNYILRFNFQGGGSDAYPFQVIK
jgi:hypothetical protein